MYVCGCNGLFTLAILSCFAWLIKVFNETIEASVDVPLSRDKQKTGNLPPTGKKNCLTLPTNLEPFIG